MYRSASPLLLLAVTACGFGAATDSPSLATTRDSAGIHIVENVGEATLPAVAPAPVLSIGEMDGPAEYQLYQVRAATRLHDGSIVVFDGGSQEVRFYDSTGVFVRRVGGKGGGPGEYQRVAWLRGLAGDSLMLYDPGAQRITILSPDGSTARSVSVAAVQAEARPGADGERSAPTGGMAQYSAIGPMADGALLATTAGPRSEARAGSAVRRDSVVYVSLTAGGLLRDTLATLIGDEEQVNVGGSEGRRVAIVGPPPLGRTSHVATDGSGFWFGSGDRYEIWHRDPEGRVDRIVRRAVELIAVTPALLDAARAEDLGRATSAPAEVQTMVRQMIEDRWSSAVPPATMPAHGELLAGDSLLWVAETTLPGDPSPRWTAFDPEGQMLGTVALPARFRALGFGPGYVLGVSTDENGVERVEQFALEIARTPS